MTKYIKYRVTALENLKIGNKMMSQNFEHETLKYISGSSLRGAFIAKYISSYGENRLDELLKLRFTNAYIVSNEKRALPICQNLYANKTDKDKEEFDIFDIFEKQKERCVSIGGGFGIIEGTSIIGVPVKTGQNLHISTRKLETENERAMFRYDYIRKEQEFEGFVVSDAPHIIDIVMDVIKENAGLCYVGGSKGTGYGMCKISELCECDAEFPCSFQFPKDTFNIMLLSDAIVKDENGHVTSEIPLDIIKKRTGLDFVEPIDVARATRIVNVGGYNAKMKSNLKQYSCIGAGSVFKYKFKGEINQELVKQWMNHGIGERREDGFGRFVLDGNLQVVNYKRAQEIKRVDLAESDMAESAIDYKIGLSFISKKIFENKLHTLFHKERLALMNGLSFSDKNLDKKIDDRIVSKIGNLINHLESIRSLSPQKGKAETIKFYDHIGEKAKKNPMKFGFYQNATIEKKSLKDFMLNCIDVTSEGYVSKRLVNIKEKFEIEIAREDLRDEEVYQKGLYFAIDFFKFVLAQRGKLQ